MPTSGDCSVHFPCPRCFARLKASLAQAGTRRRCPRCQWVFEVPTESRGMERHEGYAVGEGTAGAPGADQPYITVECPVCSTRMYVTEDQVGREIVCPDCDAPTVVPPPAKVEQEAQKQPPAVEVEGYPLCEEVDEDELHSGPRAAEQTYIPVVCPVCDTLMKVTEDQVGQEIVCPDCHVPTIVVPPAETPAKKGGSAVVEPGEAGEYAIREELGPPAAGSPAAHLSYIAVVCPLCGTRLHATEDQVGQELVCPDCDEPTIVVPAAETPAKKGGSAVVEPGEAGEYAICEEVGPPAAGSPAAHLSYIAVVCPLCGTRLHATEDQVGQELVCPDCNELLVVPAPASKPRAVVRAEPVGEYGTRETAEVAQYEPLIHSRLWEPRPGATDDQGVPLVLRPPRWPFFSGVFHFPFYRRSWFRWMGLSVGGAVVLGLARVAVELGSQPGIVTWFVAMVLFGIVAVLGMLWTVLASGWLLAILFDTAYGYDEVENWPSGPFTDWMGESVFVINSLLLSVLPVAGVAYVSAAGGLLLGPWLPASFLVLFPIALLSMLETNSPLNPLSPPTWRSMLAAWWGWGLFYLETTVLIVVVGWLAWQAWAFGPLLGTVVSATACVAVLMIYFRLLGRLAWCCSRALAQAGRDSDESPTSSEVDGDKVDGDERQEG